MPGYPCCCIPEVWDKSCFLCSSSDIPRYMTVSFSNLLQGTGIFDCTNCDDYEGSYVNEFTSQLSSTGASGNCVWEKYTLLGSTVKCDLGTGNSTEATHLRTKVSFVGPTNSKQFLLSVDLTTGTTGNPATAGSIFSYSGNTINMTTWTNAERCGLFIGDISSNFVNCLSGGCDCTSITLSVVGST